MRTDTMDPSGNVIERPKEEARARPKMPSKYRVLIFNDDYTPGEFVVATLMKVFRFDYQHAVTVTMEAHTKGVGVCGEYSKDVAETKAKEVIDVAKAQAHPLMAKAEPI